MKNLLFNVGKGAIRVIGTSWAVGLFCGITMGCIAKGTVSYSFRSDANKEEKTDSKDTTEE